MASFPKPPTLNDDQRAVDIYRAAARILRAKGFDATSMGDIAEAVDLTKGGLYYYIKGKEALLFAIMSFAAEQLERRVLAPAGEVRDAESRLATAVARYLELMLDEPDAMVVLADQEERLNSRHRPAIAERKQRFGRRVHAWVADVLAARDAGGELDPAVAAAGLLALVEGVVRRLGPRHARPPKAEVVEQVTRMALHSLRSDAATAYGSSAIVA